MRPFLFRLLTVLLFAGASAKALAGSADLEGRLSYRIDGDRIAVEIERIANNTSNTTTGTLYVTVRMTADRNLHTEGYRVARHRITGSSNGTLGPGQYFGNIRWTLDYQPPPPGTYYVHFYTSQHPEPNTVLDSYTFTDTVEIEERGGPADLEGTIAYRIDGDRITVEIERIANNTSNTTTGTLYVTVRMTADRNLHTEGYRAARHRITGSSNGTLGPGRYFGNIRWTLDYQAPPPGTYYVHFYTSQHPEPNTVLDSYTFTSTVEVGESGGLADLEGTIAYRIDGDRIAVEIERIANNTANTTTGTLYVTVQMTDDRNLYTEGYRVARHRITGTSNGRLAPGQYFGDIRWTLDYQAPPRGTYYVHFYTSQHPEPSTVLDSRTFTNTVEVGGGGVGDDHGNSLLSATRVRLPSTTSGTIDPGSDTDWFRFEVSAYGEMTAETTGSLDTVGTLYDAEGNELASDDDGADAGLNFRIQRELGAGTYHVRVASFLSSTGNYVLRLRFEASNAEDDHGDSLSTATRVALPSETAGTIDRADDTDWFRFEVSASGEVTAETTGGLDTVGALYDVAGNQLASDDDSAPGPGLNFRIQRELAAGTYYVQVASFLSDTGDYVLRLRPQGSDAEDDHGDYLSSATRVALPSETAGTIDPGSDTDWFRFEVSAGGEVTAETTGGLDTEGALYDAAGNVLASDDDGADTALNFRIQRELDAGTYYLRVASFGSDTGSYVLRLEFEASDDGVNTAHRATKGHLRHLGDFDGDGKDDVLLRHQDGRWHYYRMDGRRVLSGSGEASLTTDLAYQVAGVGDFNGDGRADVLLRNDEGRWYFYPMNGRTILSGRGTAALTSDLTYRVAGIGDFDGDGKDDLLLRNEDGRWHYYRMDGRRPLAGSGGASLTKDIAYQVAGVGDFNGDGRADVLLRNDEGRWYFYPMNGRTILPGRGVGALTPDLAFRVAGIGDLDGDGKDDVLLRHEGGGWHYYRMDGRRPISGSGGASLTRDLAWQVAGIGDFDGDGRADVLLRHEEGRWYFYPMNGRTVLAGGGTADLTSDLTWAIAVPSVPERAINEITPPTKVNFVGVEYNNIATSHDGIRWKVEDASVSGLGQVAYGDGLWVAVGFGTIVVSEDGRNWTHVVSEDPNDYESDYYLLRGVAYGTGRWTAVGSNAILTSTDGRNWIAVYGEAWEEQDRNLIAFTASGVHYGNGLWVSAGVNDIFESSDGQSWRTLVSSETGGCGGLSSSVVAHGDGHWYTTGHATGYLACTRTATGSWSPFIQEYRHHGWDIEYGGGDWVAVGNSGIATWKGGTDDWYLVELPDQPSVSSVAYRSGQWVVGTSGGPYYNSGDPKRLADWIHVPIGQTEDELLQFQGIASRP